MAYTSVIPVRRLDRTVDYIQNKEKTTPKSLEEAVDYAANRDKTESACFETGLGCTTTSAFEDMRLNTLRWHKETGVQGYHLVQSFAEGEVTPELAHQIGVEFAEQLLHGKYQAIVTTHLNTKHFLLGRLAARSGQSHRNRLFPEPLCQGCPRQMEHAGASHCRNARQCCGRKADAQQAAKKLHKFMKPIHLILRIIFVR